MALIVLQSFFSDRAAAEAQWAVAEAKIKRLESVAA